MTGLYVYADGTAVPHADRNVELAKRLWDKLADAGLPEHEAHAYSEELLERLDAETGVKRGSIYA